MPDAREKPIKGKTINPFLIASSSRREIQVKLTSYPSAKLTLQII